MTSYRNFFIFIALLLPVTGLSAPKIVTTIAPIHSLVAGVTEGVTPVELLFSAGKSPHGAGLKPSQIRLLSRADLVVRIDPALERGVDRALGKSDESEESARVLTLSRIEGITLHRARNLDLHAFTDSDEDDDGSDHDHDHGHLHDGELDPHLWLSTENASLVIQAVAERLSILDAANTDLYNRNAANMREKVATLHNAIKTKMVSINAKWLFFHDAYQYFEKEFDLSPMAIVTPDPERAVSGKRLQLLVGAVETEQLDCLFIEPQLRPDLVIQLSEKADVQILELDPLGSEISPGPNLWFEVMGGLSDQLVAC